MNLRLDLFDLQLFIHIADASSLTQGASRSAISAAAASTRIRNMEATVGARLLNRTPQGATLTAAGRALLAHAQQIMQQMEHLSFDMRDFSRGLRGQVKVYAHTTSMTEFMPQALSGFLAQHQDVEIELREALSDDIVRAVAAGEADIGVVSSPVGTGELWARPFGSNRLVVILPPSSELARVSSISFTETLRLSCIALPGDTALHRFMARVATQSGGNFRPRVQVSNFEAVCRMVEAGVGIGIAPISSVERYVKSMNIRYIALEDPWAIREVSLVTQPPDTLPTLVKNLSEHLVGYAKANSRMRVDR
ncbi:LysR substrate-binding domain-containing protein [Paraburkholderia phenazinium]|uniref:DNA-binding transcriptional regulator, LysR family n=1 Tax=Paraburkholderia phenazinium TaxID=60549 RepID=A0A1N6JEU0_9BURK|nr:LysR substrate-binding domain-containing protein [Paraburkholderia phenazinium]SIO42659.1 DNA-binding transcriptional regulator, LysR family [Paraburkholderia phenazinium]